MLFLVFTDCKTHSYEEEKECWDKYLESVDLRVEWVEVEVVKIPEDMQEYHGDDRESSEGIEFDESPRAIDEKIGDMFLHR